MLQLARQDERFFDKGRESAPGSFVPDIQVRRWGRGHEYRVDMFSFKKVAIVRVDMRVRKTGRGGGARSCQGVGNGGDLGTWKTAQRGGVINLRQPAESDDR